MVGDEIFALQRLVRGRARLVPELDPRLDVLAIVGDPRRCGHRVSHELEGYRAAEMGWDGKLHVEILIGVSLDEWNV